MDRCTVRFGRFYLFSGLFDLFNEIRQLVTHFVQFLSKPNPVLPNNIMNLHAGLPGPDEGTANLGVSFLRPKSSPSKQTSSHPAFPSLIA